MWAQEAHCVQELDKELERTDLDPEHRYAQERRMVQHYPDLAQVSMAGPSERPRSWRPR